MRADTEKTLLYLGLGAGALLFLFPEMMGRLIGKTVIGAGKAAGGVIVDAGTGLVIGIGEAVGIPQTSASLCELAISEGRYWDASFYCPAGTFLKAASGAVIDTAGKLVGYGEPSSAPAVITITPAQAATPGSSDVYQAWYAATGGVLLPGQTQEQAINAWLAGVTPTSGAVDIWEGIPEYVPPDPIADMCAADPWLCMA